jgi:hypothetical protein
VKDSMVSTAGGWESTAWCDLLLRVVVVANVEWVLGPFSAWFQGKWSNLWCDSWFQYCGTCSTGVSLCMGLGRNRNHNLELCLFGCMGGVFDRWSLGFFPMDMV